MRIHPKDLNFKLQKPFCFLFIGLLAGCNSMTGCGISEGPSIAGPNQVALGHRAQLFLTAPHQGHFGQVRLYHSKTQVLTLSNLGNYPATLGNLTQVHLGLSHHFSLQGGSCVSGMQLKPKESCSLEIAFSPK